MFSCQVQGAGEELSIILSRIYLFQNTAIPILVFDLTQSGHTICIDTLGDLQLQSVCPMPGLQLASTTSASIWSALRCKG